MVMIKYALAASLVAGATASLNHQHNHQHHHAKKHAGSHIEQRKAEPDVVTEWVVGPTETVYELAGKTVDKHDAKEGLDDGEYVIIGESTPTYSPPPPPPTTTSEASLGAQFFESKTSSTSTSTTTSAPPPPPAPKPKPKPKPQPSTPGNGATGLDADFPSGIVKCSEFPSKYGAVSMDHLGLGGWISLQFVPGYTTDATSISDIIAGVSGQTCSKGCMCSYACPDGHEKAQWPAAQGSTRQSIGGLYCDPDGFLHLTREGHTRLCEPGVGGVYIQNNLGEGVATCRTNYPGDEAMTIPAWAGPGQKIPLTNPDQDTYYQWGGMATSAQYYVNKRGYPAEDVCQWDSPIDHDGAGNWAPTNIGVGRASDGITYLSIFPNKPTSNAKLDFNIKITGDVNSECSLINGEFSGGANGCTTGMKEGGTAVFTYF